MARRIPSAEENVWMNPVITFSLVVAWIAACIAIFATLCAACHRKSPAPEIPSSPSNGSGSKTETSAPVAASIQQEQDGSSVSSKADEKITELGTPIHGPIYPTSVPPSASKRKLSISLSMGLPDGLNKIKTLKKERHGKGEESLWKKTIILGEKCRLPNEEERLGEEEDNRTSRANSPRSLPPSRTASLAKTSSS